MSLAPPLTALLLALVAPLCCYAQTNLPTLRSVVAPSPAPPPPGLPFDLPAAIRLTATPDNAQTPAIAEFTRTATGNETVLLTGTRFSAFQDDLLGKDTRFLLTDGSGNPLAQPNIQRLLADKALLTLPNEYANWGMYLLWPLNQNGPGQPVAINRTDAWWVGPEQASPGSSISVFGRNLSQYNDTLQAFVYLKPRLPAESTGQWLSLTEVNPYKLSAELPANLPEGEYEIWTHNGHGGQYGWSGPLSLTVQGTQPWSTTRLNVRDYGAKGDGVSDDTPAIRRALSAARQQPYSTVFFPTGVYIITDQLDLSSRVRWLGEGKQQSILRCGPSFSAQAPNLLFGYQVQQAELRDLAIEANHQYKGSYNGLSSTPIYLRASQHLTLTNVRLSFQDYEILDLHMSNHVFINSCDLIGKISFLGNASQVFIDRCRFFLTNDTELAINSWGGVGLSLTRSSCQDLDNSDPNNGAGWGKGRFFSATGNWSSNRHTYIAHNTTTDLAPRPHPGVDQNVGEQFLWEGNITQWAGSPSASTSQTTTLPGIAAFYAALPASGNNQLDVYYAVIIKGTGLGQSRPITAHQANTITLETPWNLPPDGTSLVAIGHFTDRVVLYQNQIDGKIQAVTNPEHVASAGIEPYGGVFNMVADGNHIQEVRNGIANWATQHQVGLDPNYFNLFTRNKLLNCRWGIYNATDLTNPVATAILGTVFRHNELSGSQVAGINNVLWPQNYPPTHAVLDALVYEHNTIAGPGPGYVTEGHFRGAYDYSAQNGSFANQLFYANTFTRTAGGTDQSAIALTPQIALRSNTFAGYGQLYQGTLAPPALEAPIRVITLEGQPGGLVVKRTVSLWNSGSGLLNWQAGSSASWLTVSPVSGSAMGAQGTSDVVLEANPKNLAVGRYEATVSILGAGGHQVKQLTVTLTVTNTPVFAEPLVNIVSPATNSTFVTTASIPITVAAASPEGQITKVELFSDATKIGEESTPPYNFTWTSSSAGMHTLVAKATNTEGNLLTSKTLTLVTINPINTPCAGTGSIDWQYWANRSPTTTIQDIPVNTTPSASVPLLSLAAPQNVADFYSTQIKGYVCPPMDGDYVFYIAGDDLAELYLSTDDYPVNKRKIAYADWSCSRQYDKFAYQQSAPIRLRAGRAYYIEALHIEGAGDDYVLVGWKLPDGTQERPIAGSHLAPFKPAGASPTDLSVAVFTDKRVVDVGDTVTYKVTVQNNTPSDNKTPVSATWSCRLPPNTQLVDNAGLLLIDGMLVATVRQLSSLNDTTFTFRIRPTAAGTYSTQVQLLSANQPDPDSSPNTGTADGEDDAASTDFRTVSPTTNIFVSPNPNQRLLPAVIASQPQFDSTKTDLSVELAAGCQAPALGDTVRCTVLIHNTSGLTAGETKIQLQLPTGLQFVTGPGWTRNGTQLTCMVAQVAAGTTVTLPLVIRTVGRDNCTLQVQIDACATVDSDSIPGNGCTNGEDDQAQLNLRVR